MKKLAKGGVLSPNTWLLDKLTSRTDLTYICSHQDFTLLIDKSHKNTDITLKVTCTYDASIGNYRGGVQLNLTQFKITILKLSLGILG